jgi:MFS family permease
MRKRFLKLTFSDVCAQLSTLNFGIFFVYWIDYAFSSHDDSYAWRVPVILQCIFLIPMLLILFIIPESPRWLVAHGQADEALVVLQRLRSGRDDEATVQRLHQDIVQNVAMEASLGVGSWKDLLKSDHIKSQQRLLIACAIQSFQQLGGINAIICKPPSTT